LVALLMLNCLLAPVAAEPEFGPELARAEPPAAEAVEPLWSAELAFAPPELEGELLAAPPA